MFSTTGTSGAVATTVEKLGPDRELHVWQQPGWGISKCVFHTFHQKKNSPTGPKVAESVSPLNGELCD